MLGLFCFVFPTSKVILDVIFLGFRKFQLGLEFIECKLTLKAVGDLLSDQILALGISVREKPE